jgi:hypothetical protein
MMLAPDARRRIATRGVIYSELDGSTAAVEGEDDHEVVAILPYKTMG